VHNTQPDHFNSYRRNKRLQAFVLFVVFFLNKNVSQRFKDFFIVF